MSGERKQSDLGPDERWQHDQRRLEDADAKVGVRRARVVDLFERWEKERIITPSMREAAHDFERDFHVASLTPYYAHTDPNRVHGHSEHTPTQRQVSARLRVEAAMSACGKLAGPLIRAVVGEGMTLKEYTLRLRWSEQGVFVNESVAKGVLIAGLGVLAKHYRR